MKRDHQSECGVCGNEERWLLHNVRHRGTYRRLCTNCILENHQGLFCPICLDVFDDPPPPHVRLMCLKCPSISHLSCCCVPDNSASTFTCPPCSNPNFTFFNANTNLNAKRLNKGDTFSSNDDTNAFVLDRDSAKALVAAARIAAVSMTKAASLARVEAERRVKEATLAKKRAREALERLVYLAAKEKDSKFKGSVTVATEQQKVKSRIGGSDGISKNGVTLEGNDNKQSKGSNGLYSVSLANAGKLQTSHGNVG